MRDPLAAVLQVLISVTVVATGLPGVLFTLPAARDARVGTVLAVTLVVTTFALLRLFWSRRR